MRELGLADERASRRSPPSSRWCTVRRKSRPIHKRELDFEQVMELEFGPRSCEPQCRGSWHHKFCTRFKLFPSDEAREAAYWSHRAEIAEDDSPGCRSWSWFEYEAHHHPQRGEEIVWLAANGHVDDEEAGEIIAHAEHYARNENYQRAVKILKAQLKGGRR